MYVLFWGIQWSDWVFWRAWIMCVLLWGKQGNDLALSGALMVHVVFWGIQCNDWAHSRAWVVLFWGTPRCDWAKWSTSNLFVLRSAAWGTCDVGCLGVCHRKDEHREQGVGNEECRWYWMSVCVCMVHVTHTHTYLHTHACRHLPSTEKKLMNELGI